MAGRKLTFSKGSNLFSKDQPSHQVYFLRSGQVRLSANDEAILDHLGPGSFFSEKVFLDGGAGDQTATALEPVEVVAFRKAELVAQMRANPVFGARMLRDLAARLDRYEQTVRDLVTVQADIRLARLLGRLAPAGKSGWVKLPIAFTNPDLARMVGTTRWRVSNLLNRFQRLGWLRRTGGLWLRQEGLRAYLNSRD
jgi:CRP-like cAMP-binding protein